MNKFRNVINKYIKDNEKRKRYTAFLLALSVLVMFFVPLELTENADSMTIGTPGGAILTEQLKNVATSGVIDLSKEDSGHFYHYVNGDKTINGFIANVMTNGENLKLDKPTIDLSQGSSSELEFNVEYAVNNLSSSNLPKGAEKHFCFPIAMEGEGTEVHDLTFYDNKNGCGYTFENMAQHGIIDNEYSDSERAGHYYIDNGMVYIKLTDDYIDFLVNRQGATGVAIGSMKFKGSLGANGDAGESGKIKVGNEEIEVKFTLPEKDVNLEKEGIVSSDGKNITWTIKLDNNQGFNLADCTISDDMLAKATSVTITPSDVANWTGGSNTITFNNSVKSDITIEYVTPIESIFGELDTNGDKTIDVDSVSNAVSLKNGSNEEKKKSDKKVPIKPTIEKKGEADYSNNEIDWTITVKNDNGIALNGYTIEDSKFGNADITIQYGDTTNTTKASNGVLTLPDNIGNPNQITITYSTAPEYSTKDDYGKLTHHNENTAILKKGELTVDKSYHNPEYKKESDMYKLTKSGSYNADTGKITWEVEVAVTESGMSLTDHKLVDPAFNGKELKDFNFTYAGNMWDSNNLLNNNSIEKYVDFSGNTMTFKKATDGGTVEKVKFTYTTDATPKISEDTTQENSIELEKPKGTTPVASTKVSVKVDKPRNTFTKTVDQSNVSVGKTNGEKEVTLHWTVTLISDDGFAGKTFDDTFKVPDGVTSKIDNVKLYSKKAQNDYNKTEITSGFTANGADITFANDFTTSNNEHYIVLEYDTVVTLPKVTDSSKYDSNGQITYTVNNSGSGSFGEGPGEGVGVTITRENPNANNTKFSLGKSWNWNGKSNAIQKVYAYIEAKDSTGKVSYVAYGNDTNSYKLVDSANYTVASANENGILFEVSSADSWNKEFKGLPSSKEGENGTLITYTYTAHEYSINDTNTTFENGKDYIVLNDGSIVKRTGEWQTSISNTYYPNDGFTVKKSWDGDNGSGSDVQSITVQIQRKENGGEWKDYKTETISGSDWTKTFDSTNYPKAVIDDNGNIVEYSYRVIEKSITMNGKVIESSPSDDSKIIFVNSTNGDYYETNNVVSVNGTEITLANTYHKASNITISAEKKWNVNNIWQDYDSLDDLRKANEDVYTSLKSVNIKLQKKAVNADAWDDVPNSERVIDAKGNITDSNGNTATLEWSDLEKQKVVDGELVKYEYRVVEYGFTTSFNDEGTPGDNTVSFVGNTFAPNPNSSYTIKYNGSNEYATSKDGDNVTIKNTYVPESIIPVQPTKEWTYDESDKNDYDKPENRADSVTFVLQQKNSKGHQGEWVDYEVNGTPVTVTFTKSANNDNSNNGNTNWTEYTVLPDDTFDLTKLPDGWVEKIVDEQTGIRTYKPRKYEYRFVETSVTINGTSYDLNYGDAGMYADSITGETEQIPAIDGKYISTISGYKVENLFKPNKGIEKYSVDKNANKVESLDIEALEQYKRKLNDGNEYYVFNYVIEFTKNEMRPIVDILPADFSLVEEIHSTAETGEYVESTDTRKLSVKAGMNPNDSYWTNGCVNDNSNYPIAEGYYAAPMMFIVAPPPKEGVWSNTAEWGAYFWGWYDADTRKTDINDIFKGIGPNGDAIATGAYVYDEDSRQLTLGSVTRTNPDASVYVAYSIKIEKAKLEEKLSNGNFSIVNEAQKYDGDGNYTNVSAENKLVIKKPDNLIDKAFAETLIPGQVKYTIDVNPDAKTLSNGSTVRITDVFDTISYTLVGTHKYCKKHGDLTEEGSRLVDVLLNSLKVYAYDANGNKVPLKSNEYTFVFKNGTDAKEGAATLELNVPDSTHISIEYTYKLIANENTPSVKQGCKSPILLNGRYPVMKSGMDLPVGDKISMKNKARLETESNSAEKEKVVNNYEIKDSDALIKTTLLPKIQKVNIADYTINDLEADFLLAYYGEDEAGDEGWVYATEIKDKKVTWGSASETIPNDAFVISLDGTKPYEVNLPDGVLYRLIEVGVPEGYEGSNLKKPVGDTLVAFTSDDYKALITNYFNSGETEYADTDYSDFLKTFVFEHYFVYNAVPSSIAKPAGIDTNNIMQFQTGATVEVPNNELIKIKVEKDWVNFNKPVEDTSIILQLFWSDKNESAIPNNAVPATAENLGLMEYQDFEPVVEVPYSTSAETVWTELPNGHGNKPIYYYVKEIGYRIGKADDSDSVLYMLEESFDQTTAEKVSAYKPATEYKMSEGKVDVEWDNSNNATSEYLPTYVNNAVNSNLSESVKITNSNVLKLHKIWTDSENKILPYNSGKIDTDSIEVEIFGVEENGAQSSSLFGKIELIRKNKWYAEIPESELEDVDFSKYVSFVAKETGLPAGTNFVTSVTFKINNDTGEITVTNKNPDAVSASVSVNKVWSDGNNVHKSDSIKVTLYQVEKSKAESANLGGNPTAAELKAADAVVYGKSTTEGEETSETITNPVTLNADNDWSYIWSGLPLDDADDQPNGESTTEYVYYVVESTMNIVTNADKYTSNVTLEKTGSNYAYTISNERPSITVKKEWYNEDDKTIDAPVDDIQVRLYKEGESTLSNSLKIQTYGDSITAGNDYNQSGVSYADSGYLEANLNTNSLFKDKVSVSVGKDAQGGRELDYISGKTVSSDINAICIMLGTNNVLHKVAYGDDVANEDYKALIKSLSTDKSKPIFIATIPYLDYVDDFSSNNAGMYLRQWSEYSLKYGVKLEDWEEAQRVMNLEVDKYNEYVNQVAVALKADDDKVTVVDVNSALTDNGAVSAQYYYDGCHLSIAGVQKMADTFANAISNYYTPKEYLKADGEFTANANEAATYTIAKDDNWTTVIDLPSGFDKDTKLSVEEVENENLPRTNWTVSYENNSQTSLSTGVIVVKNKNNPSKTAIEITKNWANDNKDTDAALRENLRFTVFRSTDQEYWEEVPDDSKIDKTISDNTWKITYENLPAESPEGITYFYKIKENELEGYTSSMSEYVAQAVTGGTIRLNVTNTRSVSITVKKDWSDINTKDHNDDTVKVKLWRTLDSTKVDETLPLTLMVDSTSVSMGVNSEHTINTNRTDATFELTENNDGAIKLNGNTIEALKAGTAKITVSAGNESVVVDVTVVNLTVNVQNEIMTVGDTQNVKVFKDDGTQITSSCNFSSDNSEILTIDRNGNITAIDVGTANIIVECTISDGTELKVSKKITVEYTGDFTLKDANGNNGTSDEPIEIAVNDSITLTPDPDYGKFDFDITSGDGATITPAQDGKSVTVTAGDTSNKIVTITAIRESDKAESTYVIKVVENPEFVLWLNKVDVADSYPLSSTGETIDYFEIPMKTGDKEITLGVGKNGENIVGYNKQFTITYYKRGDSGETESRTYNAKLIEQPSVRISAEPSSITLDGDEHIVTITAEDGATITYDALPSGVLYNKETQKLTVQPDASAGTITFTATKDGYADGTCTVKIKEEGSAVTITGSLNGQGKVYFNDEQTSVWIDSIVIENFTIPQWQQGSMYFKSQGQWGDEDAGSCTNIELTSSGNCSNCTATLSDGTLTITGFSKALKYIEYWNFASGDYTITLKDDASTASVASFSLRPNSVAILADEPTGIKWTDNGDGKEYYEFEIRKSDNNNSWAKTITGLEVGKNGVNYCYWVEELPMQNYTASYNYDGEFDKHSISQTGGMVTIKNTPDTVYEGVEMPNSGGSGTAPYTTVGMIIAGGAVIALTVRRRRRKSA